MKSLLKLSLIASFLGVFVLLFLTNNQKPKEITTQSNLTLNEKVKIFGKITEEKDYGEFSVLKLKDDYGEIEIICNCENFLDKNIRVEGKVVEYKRKQIQAEKITIKNDI